ncbi:MAG TPA: hypothetical protein VGR59_04085 [Gemmatimonadaceae bacterium]|nr:hypothetical protein [Gemmatimonadaceae bacterium]
MNCDVTLVPFSVMMRVDAASAESSHQSMLTACVPEPNVLVPGVIVTIGGEFPGPQLMQMPCGLAGDGLTLSGCVVVSGFAVVSV